MHGSLFKNRHSVSTEILPLLTIEPLKLNNAINR